MSYEEQDLIFMGNRGQLVMINNSMLAYLASDPAGGGESVRLCQLTFISSTDRLIIFPNSTSSLLQEINNNTVQVLPYTITDICTPVVERFIKEGIISVI